MRIVGSLLRLATPTMGAPPKVTLPRPPEPLLFSAVPGELESLASDPGWLASPVAGWFCVWPNPEFEVAPKPLFPPEAGVCENPGAPVTGPVLPIGLAPAIIPHPFSDMLAS